MTRNFQRLLITWLVTGTVFLCSSAYPQVGNKKVPPRPDAPFVPSMWEITEAMLKLAKVHKGDVVYDLGSGDGRVVIMAAEKFDARGVGVEMDPALITESRINARKAGVARRVRFIQQDLFKTDISRATVVTLYLRQEVNLRLRPKLLRELKAGTRVVSNSFDMGDWKPDKVTDVRGNPVYLWTIPAKARKRT
ncbi:MAG: SAM-dependent methyltransferase [Pyrinomonadaceae bacterium]